MSLVELYKEWLVKPCHATFGPFFRAVIEAHEDHSDALYEEFARSEPVWTGNKRLRSSGSSGDGVYWYHVGPMFHDLRWWVERFIRSPLDPEWGKVFIRSLFPEKTDPTRYERPIIALQLEDPNCGYALIERIEEYLKRCPGACLYTFYRQAQRFTQLPYLMDYLESVKDRVVVSTSNVDAMFRHQPYIDRGIYCNDHMINWKTGVSFYTCRFGTRHLLRNLYAERDGCFINLLNFNNKLKTPKDDVFSIDEGICQCGRGFRLRHFIPHFHHTAHYPDGRVMYDLSIAEKVTSQWYAMQFLSRGDGTYCYYLADEPLDRELIQNHFGLSMNFVENVAFCNPGRKCPAFWGSESLVELIPRTAFVDG